MQGDRHAMKKVVTWYVYDSAIPRRYLGAVKATNGTKAMEIAHDKYGTKPLDVIRKKYIADRKLGTMTGPKKQQQ